MHGELWQIRGHQAFPALDGLGGNLFGSILDRSPWRSRDDWEGGRICPSLPVWGERRRGFVPACGSSKPDPDGCPGGGSVKPSRPDFKPNHHQQRRRFSLDYCVVWVCADVPERGRGGCGSDELDCFRHGQGLERRVSGPVPVQVRRRFKHLGQLEG